MCCAPHIKRAYTHINSIIYNTRWVSFFSSYVCTVHDAITMGGDGARWRDCESGFTRQTHV